MMFLIIAIGAGCFLLHNKLNALRGANTREGHRGTIIQCWLGVLIIVCGAMYAGIMIGESFSQP